MVVVVMCCGIQKMEDGASNSVTNESRTPSQDYPRSYTHSNITPHTIVIHFYDSINLLFQITTTLQTDEEKELPLSFYRSLVYEAYQYILSTHSSSSSSPPSSTSPLTSSSPLSSLHDSSKTLTFDIDRLHLPSWQTILTSKSFKSLLHPHPSPSSSISFSPLSLIGSNLFTNLHNFFSSVRHEDSLMFVQGTDLRDLDLYSNWIRDDDKISFHDLLVTTTTTTTSTRTSHHLSPSSTEEDDDRKSGVEGGGDGCSGVGFHLPSVLSLILAHGYEMPAPNIRVLLQQTRTATDMYGKDYTVYNMVVIQGKLEWMIEHRYSGTVSLPLCLSLSIDFLCHSSSSADFVRLHEALLSQSEEEMGSIPRHLLPPLTTKKLHSRSLKKSIVDKRRIKLGRYINTLVSIEQAMSNHYGPHLLPLSLSVSHSLSISHSPLLPWDH
jgi:hypothetical protein